jgi:cytidylate kinase
MTANSIDIITISREFGAGGSSVAAAVSTKLGWPVLDSDVAQRVADRLHVERELVEKLDEQPTSLIARIARVLLISHPETQTVAPYVDIADQETIADAARAVVEEAGRTPPLIVVGHGGQAIFRGRSGTFHVRLVAPIESRVRRICARLPCDVPTAEARVRRVDSERREYLRRNFEIEWRDELLYDLQINTGRLSIENAAELILQAVGGRR